MSDNDITPRKMDPLNPPALTAEQEAELAALAALDDSQIDTSDIPPLENDFWKRAVRNPFYKPVKTQLTVRVDTDVLAWLRAGGKGYQTKINAILRQAMLQDIDKR